MVGIELRCEACNRKVGIAVSQDQFTFDVAEDTRMWEVVYESAARPPGMLSRVLNSFLERYMGKTFASLAIDSVARTLGGGRGRIAELGLPREAS